MNILTKILIPLSAIAVVCSCGHDIVEKAYFNVTQDPGNAYVAGEPVTFNITGDIDNILFFSGEQGSEYQYKDRYSVPVENVNSASLFLEYQPRYGDAGALEVWISDSFKGLDGQNGEADRKTVSEMIKNMSGWKRLDYSEGNSQEWTEQSYLLTDSLKTKKNFTLAFHWNPKKYCETDAATGEIVKYVNQRTYWLNGKINLDIKDVKTLPIDLSELTFVVLSMNEEADPYHKNSGNGSVVLNSENADIIFQGVGQVDSLNYAIDAWAISQPIDLNMVQNDKGIIIKNQQNYLKSYSYTWNEPGTYKVVFVGTNSNIMDSSVMMQELTITILDKLK